MSEHTLKQVAEILGIDRRSAGARARKRGVGHLVTTSTQRAWMFTDDDLAALRVPMRSGPKVRQ